MSTFSNNTTQKIAGGTAFNRVTSGTTQFTTAANQKARVRVKAYIVSVTPGFPATLTITNGGQTMESLAVNNSAENIGASVKDYVEFLVPPSSTFAITLSLGASTSGFATGSYIIEENTP